MATSLSSTGDFVQQRKRPMFSPRKEFNPKSFYFMRNKITGPGPQLRYTFSHLCLGIIRSG